MEEIKLDLNDVIASDSGDIPFRSRLGMSQTFRVKELRTKLQSYMVRELKFDVDYPNTCQVLQCENTGWKTGKVQAKLEFYFVEESSEDLKGNNVEDSSGELDELRSLDVEEKE
jgi:hypothetical protein